MKLDHAPTSTPQEQENKPPSPLELMQNLQERQEKVDKTSGSIALKDTFGRDFTEGGINVFTSENPRSSEAYTLANNIQAENFNSSIESLDTVVNDLLEQAKELGSDATEEQIRESYENLEYELPAGFEDAETVIRVTKFKEDDKELVVESEDSEERESTPTSKKAIYLTRVHKNEQGEIMALVSAPSPYEYGNAIFVARGDIEGIDLSGADELLNDPQVTKGIFKELTGAKSVSHTGGQEAVQHRVASLLEMPEETFTGTSQDRQSYYKRAANQR